MPKLTTVPPTAGGTAEQFASIPLETVTPCGPCQLVSGEQGRGSALDEAGVKLTPTAYLPLGDQEGQNGRGVAAGFVPLRLGF